MKLKLCIPVVAASVTAFLGLGLAPTAQAAHGCDSGSICFYPEKNYNAAWFWGHNDSSLPSLTLEHWVYSVYNNTNGCVFLYSEENFAGQQLSVGAESGRASLPWAPVSYRFPEDMKEMLECVEGA